MSFEHIPNKNHNSESGQYFEIKKPRNYLYEATPEWPKKGDLNDEGYPDPGKWIAWRDAKMKSDDAAERAAKYNLKIDKSSYPDKSNMFNFFKNKGGKRRTRKSRKSKKSRKSRKTRRR